MAGGDAGVEVAGGTEEEGEWHDIADVAWREERGGD